MREYFRPYNKIVDIATTTQHVVLLTDTSGGTMLCNYITVGALSSSTGADGGIFQVVPSGTDTMYGHQHEASGTWQTVYSMGGPTASGALSGRDRGPSGYVDASARATNSPTVNGAASALSGVLGMVGSVASDTLIFSLAPYDSARAIILTQSKGVTAKYVVTYGQVNEANSRADIRVPRGEQTWSAARG